MRKRVSALLLAAILLLSGCGARRAASESPAPDEGGRELEEIDQLYLGRWQDMVSQRTTMEIAEKGESGYEINIRWLFGSVRETWRMSAVYDPELEALSYTDGIKTRVTYGDSGELVEEKVVWRNSRGTLTCREEHIYWSDSRESGDEWRFARHQSTGYTRIDPAGSFVEAGDGQSTLVVVPLGGETYQVTMDLAALTALEGVGGYEDNVFAFTGADPNGEDLTAVITKDGKDVLVTVTHSRWSDLPVGTCLSFLRPMPELTAEVFRDFFAVYTCYNPYEQGAEAGEAEAVWALVRFAEENLLAYVDNDTVHQAAYEGYMALDRQERGRLDYNIYHGLYQLAERAFDEYEEVRARFDAVGRGEEMAGLVETIDGYAHWTAMRTHLFSIGVPVDAA